MHMTVIGVADILLRQHKRRPPVSSIDAVENREWLWQRPYTTLELRDGDSIRTLVAHPSEDALGFRGVGILCSIEDRFVRDPDGVQIHSGNV